MKIRTTEELVDVIDADLIWRRKELSDLRYLVQTSAGSKTRQNVTTRAGIALLYAHWEGFVKKACEAYLEFVYMQRCRNSELSPNMLAIAIRSILRNAQHSNRISAHLEVVDFFLSKLESRASLPYKAAIRTEANLSSTVLTEILQTVGIDSTGYETKRHMIDNQLLAKRNHIAHGDELDIGVDDYLLLHEEFTAMMSNLRTQIQNAAVMREYCKP